MSGVGTGLRFVDAEGMVIPAGDAVTVETPRAYAAEDYFRAAEALRALVRRDLLVTQLWLAYERGWW